MSWGGGAAKQGAQAHGQSGVYPGGSWRAVGLVLGIFLRARGVAIRKGAREGFRFRSGVHTPRGTKDDFLGYRKKLLDLLCAFNLILKKYIFVYREERSGFFLLLLW